MYNCKASMQGGQLFRDEHMWLLEIDDCLKTNLNSIVMVYKYFLSGMDKNNLPNTELDLKQILAIGPILELTDL